MVSAGYGSHAYQQSLVEGADQRHLVVLLTRALVKFTMRAREAMQRADFEAKANALERARAIISELQLSLDDRPAPELARNLRALYVHWYRELVKADLDDDLAAVDYVLDCAGKLAEAWEEAYQKCREQEQRQAA